MPKRDTSHVIPGSTRNPDETNTARYARHWIPVCVGMTAGLKPGLPLQAINLQKRKTSWR